MENLTRITRLYTINTSPKKKKEEEKERASNEERRRRKEERWNLYSTFFRLVQDDATLV